MSLPLDRRTFVLIFVLGLLVLTVLPVSRWRLPSWNKWVSSSSARASLSPEDAIYCMLDAERAGDTTAFLEAFSGSIREQLLQIIKENGRSNFSSYLTQNAGFEGVAITITDQPNSEEAKAQVDYVYSDREEEQKLYLKRDRDVWKILRVEGDEQIKTLFLFGSPVTD